ncbi:MAG: hypothetical protein IMY70_01275 [Bacteroidetes bacterium]|nr:hypothetical protein [Bacteroidota bacterium]
MKVSLFIILVLVLLSSCQPTKKLIDAGKYDQSIDLLVMHLSKNPRNKKNIQYLGSAYNKANIIDQERIIALKKTGQPDIWYQICQYYVKLDNRQEKVGKLPTHVLQNINYKWINYKLDIEVSKKKAAEYYYAHAGMLLKKGDRASAQKAFEELMIISGLFKDYKDVDELLRHVLGLGGEYVLIKVINRSGSTLPPHFAKDITDFNLNNIERNCLDYDVVSFPGRKYPFTIRINIDNIFLSPDKTTKKRFEKSRVLMEKEQLVSSEDAENKISCVITEVIQRKSAILSGSVGYFDNTANKLIYKTPVQSRSSFQNSSYNVEGDLRACPPEIIKKMNARDKPFPSDKAMIRDVTEKLKIVIKGVIWNKDYIID